MVDRHSGIYQGTGRCRCSHSTGTVTAGNVRIERSRCTETSADAEHLHSITYSWACATTMDTRELPLQALEQAISWAASHGGTDGLVHRSDHGARYIGLVYATGVGECGMLPSTGTVGDS